MRLGVTAHARVGVRAGLRFDLLLGLELKGYRVRVGHLAQQVLVYHEEDLG